MERSIVIPADVVYRVLDEESVLLNLRNGTYFGLDPVGTRAWQLMVEHGSLARVLELLLEEYEVDRDVLERDLLSLGRRLCESGLAEVVAPEK